MDAACLLPGWPEFSVGVGCSVPSSALQILRTMLDGSVDAASALLAGVHVAYYSINDRSRGDVSWYGGTVDAFLAGGGGNVYDAGEAGIYSLTNFAFCATLALGLVGLIAVQRNLFTLPGWISVALLLAFTVVSIQLGARLRILFLFMGLFGAIGAQIKRKSFIKVIALGSIVMVFFVYAQGRLRYEFAF